MIVNLNKAICIGLLISGICLLSGYLLGITDILDYLSGILLGAGAYFGLFFGLPAILFFISGTSMFLAGRLENYWQTLYPLNFGLALLGISFFQHTILIPSARVLFALSFALAISLVLHKTGIIKSRWVVFPMTIPLFIRGDFWASFVISMIFISLAVAQGAMKTLLSGCKTLKGA